MDAKDFFSKVKTPPILFLGAGISKRYYNSAYSWDDLLKQISKDIHGDDRNYFNIKNKHIDLKTNIVDFAGIATDLELALENLSQNERDNRFPEVEKVFYSSTQRVTKQSRLKIHASHLISNLKIKDDERTKNEIKALKEASNKINSIITTNYDTFIEDCIAENTDQQNKLGVIIGNDIILTSPYGSIYKIHGCTSDPSTIILTKEDYKIFEQEYEIIKAHLLSLFAHNPIIFMGYSLGDENIKSILKTIFKAIKYKSELANRVQENFLIIEYQENNSSIQLENHSLDIDGTMIKTFKLRTDSFIDIYNHISRINLTVSPHEIRVFDIVNKRLQSGGEQSVILNCNLDDVDSKDRVICISTEPTKTVTTVSDLIADYFEYMEGKEKLPKENELDKIDSRTNILFPAIGFTQITKCKSILKTKTHQIKTIDKIKKEKIKDKDINIKDLLSDHKDKNNLTHILSRCTNGKQDLKHLEDYLKKELPDLKNKEGKMKNITKDTFTKKLLIIYDYIKYGETEFLK